ncbi:FtsB family cell division protein [Nocardia farcinica]|uniref:FtsB family cell division protein n=1 Tax=Nocardia farcinica TaxID=37329 RepID=UPI002455A699|nr:septum formation initiator family protein [Nocardia farcinica]
MNDWRRALSWCSARGRAHFLLTVLTVALLTGACCALVLLPRGAGADTARPVAGEVVAVKDISAQQWFFAELQRASLGAAVCAVIGGLIGLLGLSTGKAVILAVVICALALTLSVPMRTYFSQRAEAAQLAQERRELEADLARLRDRRAQQEDPAFIRSEAKDRLRLVMPGETPYIVQVPGIEAPPRPSGPTQSRTPDPWYTDLWRTIAQPPPAEPATPPSAVPTPTAPPQPAPEGPR